MTGSTQPAPEARQKVASGKRLVRRPCSSPTKHYRALKSLSGKTEAVSCPFQGQGELGSNVFPTGSEGAQQASSNGARRIQ